MYKPEKIVLASKSPRRKELLEQIGVEFCIIPALEDEVITKKIPEDVVKELSMQKAQEVSMHCAEETMIIGADTIVSCGTEILGKPKDEEDALKMLKMLQGRSHNVFTGVYIIVKDKNNKNRFEFGFSEKTEVFFREMSDEQIVEYIKTGEPMDKAGSYAIQGICAKYIEKINGDYNNVVGLPVSALYQELKNREIIL